MQEEGTRALLCVTTITASAGRLCQGHQIPPLPKAQGSQERVLKKAQNY